MIDTLAFKLPFLHSGIPSDTFLKVTHDGEVQWESRGSSTLEGTYSSKATIKSIRPNEDGLYEFIRIECSPKFVQGHNIYGTEKIDQLVMAIITKVKKSLAPSFPHIQHYSPDLGRIEIDRLDINRMFALPTRGDVRNWLRAATYTAHTRSGRPVTKQGTVYWQKRSRRWSIKAYSKGDEIQDNKLLLPSDDLHKALIHSANTMLRLEVTLRQLELRQNKIQFISDLDEARIDSLYTEYLGRLKMTEKLRLTHQQFEDLPRKLKRTYGIWQSGGNPLDYLSKSTFYQHRSELLELGIDISNPFAADKTNIIPLVRVLEAKPVATPDWVISSGLVIAA